MKSQCSRIIGLAFLAIILVTLSATAEEQPVQLSLFSPVQLFSEDTSIKGVRLSAFYGKNTSVTGLDWAWLVSHNTSGESVGLQLGLVGLVEADFTGWQDNGINIVKGNFEGFQWGLVNYANYAHGLQLGFVNYSVSMKGMQIGLVNIIKQGGMFPIFPIVNWSF